MPTPEPTPVWSGAGAVSPVWDARAETIVWVTDAPEPAAHAWSPRSGETTTTALPGRAGAVAPRVGGGLVANCDTGVALIGRDDAWLVWWERAGAGAGAAAVDADGRLWAASTGWLAVVGPDGTARVERAAGVVTGLAWRGAELLVVEDGALTTHAPGADSGPDVHPAAGLGGVCVDEDGSAWVTTPRGVTRVPRDGEPARVHDVDGATGCAFGGPRLVDLYVTTTTGVLVLADAGAGLPTTAFLR